MPEEATAPGRPGGVRQRDQGAGATDDRQAELYEQIGRLKMELEWVKKKAAPSLGFAGQGRHPPAAVERAGRYCSSISRIQPQVLRLRPAARK